jgi:pimeloyl-ACP methyl ester carboxylesterase
VLKNPLFIAIVAGVVISSVAMINNRMKPSESKPAEAAKDSSHGAGKEAAELADLNAIEIKEIPNRPKGERAKVNGIEMYYEIFGEGEPLLLIHGGGATIESWFCQIPEFAGKYKVIAADSRGHGRTSDADGPINFEVMAADFGALLDHLGLKNVMILGWSDGGVIGLELAIRRPDLVRKVITLGAHARPEGMAAEFKAEVEGATPENFLPMLVEGYKALSPDGPEHWPVIFGKLKTMWLTLPDFKDEQLRGIQCPVLLLAGEYDIVREEESTRMASLIPKARLKILKGATHYSPVQIPDIVNKEIIDFLGEP